MTISNTYASNDPLANPLNSATLERARSIGRINWGTSGNPKDVSLPDPLMLGQFSLDERGKLTVPNQDVPMGDQLRGNGFIPGYDNLFRLSDGTVLDFKSRKVVFQNKPRRRDYWGDPDQVITFWQNGANEWHDDALEDVMSGNVGNSQDDNIDPESAQYWLKAEEEASMLLSQMTDAQKKMIADFERHFPKSKLIEESKKAQKTSTISKGEQL